MKMGSSRVGWVVEKEVVLQAQRLSVLEAGDEAGQGRGAVGSTEKADLFLSSASDLHSVDGRADG